MSLPQKCSPCNHSRIGDTGQIDIIGEADNVIPFPMVVTRRFGDCGAARMNGHPETPGSGGAPNRPSYVFVEPIETPALVHLKSFKQWVNWDYVWCPPNPHRKRIRRQRGQVGQTAERTERLRGERLAERECAVAELRRRRQWRPEWAHRHRLRAAPTPTTSRHWTSTAASIRSQALSRCGG